MPDPIPTCFRGGEAAAGAAPAEAMTTTSVYETHLGLVALTWSRNVLGLSLRVDLRVSPDKREGYYEEEEEEAVLRFRIRPWLLWKRRGGKRFELKDHPSRRHVQFMWDLTSARFPSGGGGPEPAYGFFVSMDVDGEMVLVAGDLREEAYKKTKAQRPTDPFFSKYPVLISRREHVVLGESTSVKTYNTTAIYNGKEREISIDLGGAKEKERGDSGMLVSIDGKVVLQIRRLKWKFRGSQKVEVDGGDRIQVSWDLHNWLFRPPEPPTQGPSPTPETAAVFVFRFEGDGAAEMKRWEEAEGEGCSGKKGGGGLGVYRKMVGGYFGKINGRNWSDSSSGGGEKRKGRQKRLVKTSSSSSMSSMSSSASGSSVMEWASAEEVEMQRGQGFSLLVYAWKR